MSKQKETKIQQIIWMPESLHTKLKEHLHNPAKGYVDRGALSSFINQAIEKALANEKVSLADFFGENSNG